MESILIIANARYWSEFLPYAIYIIMMYYSDYCSFFVIMFLPLQYMHIAVIHFVLHNQEFRSNAGRACRGLQRFWEIG